MPRTGKGGKREGTAGTAYANRTDLNNRGPQPVTTSPGEPYGQRTMLADAQKAIPMGGTPQPAGGTTSGTTPQAPTPHVAPGSLPWMHESERPWENSGDKPAVQSSTPLLTAPPLRPTDRLADALAQAAAHPYATQAVKELAALAAAVKA